MMNRVVRAMNGKPVWGLALVLLLTVMAVVFGTPYLVLWAFPSMDHGLLYVGNMFLGMFLGAAAVLVVAWRWLEARG